MVLVNEIVFVWYHVIPDKTSISCSHCTTQTQTSVVHDDPWLRSHHSRSIQVMRDLAFRQRHDHQQGHCLAHYAICRRSSLACPETMSLARQEGTCHGYSRRSNPTCPHFDQTRGFGSTLIRHAWVLVSIRKFLVFNRSYATNANVSGRPNWSLVRLHTQSVRLHNGTCVSGHLRTMAIMSKRFLLANQ